MAKRCSFLEELLEFIVQNKAWVIAPIILVLRLALERWRSQWFFYLVVSPIGLGARMLGCDRFHLRRATDLDHCQRGPLPGVRFFLVRGERGAFLRGLARSGSRGCGGTRGLRGRTFRRR